MRIPFKTEDALVERYASLSEISKLDYHRRLDDARYIGLAAYLARNEAASAEAMMGAKTQQGKRNQLLMLGMTVAVGIIAITFEIALARTAFSFVLLAWIALAAIQNYVLIPTLDAKRQKSFDEYQVWSRRWQGVVGPGPYADYLRVVEAEYIGGVVEDAESVYLRVRGVILLTVGNCRHQP